MSAATPARIEVQNAYPNQSEEGRAQRHLAARGDGRRQPDGDILERRAVDPAPRAAEGALVDDGTDGVVVAPIRRALGDREHERDVVDVLDVDLRRVRKRRAPCIYAWNGRTDCSTSTVIHWPGYTLEFAAGAPMKTPWANAVVARAARVAKYFMVRKRKARTAWGLKMRATEVRLD